MIDGSEKRNRQLPFELQNSRVCEKRSKQNSDYKKIQTRPHNGGTLGFRLRDALV